jgi:hypothetical protein
MNSFIASFESSSLVFVLSGLFYNLIPIEPEISKTITEFNILESLGSPSEDPFINTVKN